MKSQALQFMESLVGPTTVGMLIRAYRTLHDITQEQLAKKLKLKKSYISDLENDRKLPSLAKVKEIAEMLNDGVALYVRIWTEQTYRESGLEFDVISNVRPLKKSVLDTPRPSPTGRSVYLSPRHLMAKKTTQKKAGHAKKALHHKAITARKKASKKA